MQNLQACSATMKLRVRVNQDENAGCLERREGVARPVFQASGGVFLRRVWLMIAVDRVCRWFFRFRRNRLVPGRLLTDHQMRLYMKSRPWT